MHKLAEHCKYGVLREELIRIVVGIRDAKLSEKMQLNPKLDLATAIVQVKQHEEVKKQQIVLRSADSPEQIDAVSYNSKRQAYRKNSAPRVSRFQPQPASTNPKQCGKCGKTPTHAWTECPAKDAECRKCQKRGLCIGVQINSKPRIH